MSINSKIAKDKPELAFDAANDDATLSLTDQELEWKLRINAKLLDILDLSLIVAYFNFVNRIALGLGVTYSAEEMSGYRDD